MRFKDAVRKIQEKLAEPPVDTEETQAFMASSKLTLDELKGILKVLTDGNEASKGKLENIDSHTEVVDKNVGCLNAELLDLKPLRLHSRAIQLG
jgi:hypothetical protein